MPGYPIVPADVASPWRLKLLPLLLIAAATFWIGSELVELLMGGRSAVSLWMTAAFHQLMVFGIWGAYRGRGERRGSLALLATVLVSVGYLVLIYPPVVVALDPGQTIEGFMDANPMFTAAGLAAVFGKVFFGISILRTRIDPAWTGGVLILGPLLFAGVMLAGGAASIAIAANVCVSVALLTLGMRALQPPLPGR